MSAFADSQLSIVSDGESVETIKKMAFYKTKINSVGIFQNVVDIEEKAFHESEKSGVSFMAWKTNPRRVDALVSKNVTLKMARTKARSSSKGPINAVIKTPTAIMP